MDDALRKMEKLREHLQLVLPIVDEFCQSNGYIHVHPSAIGRYPRIRIEKQREFIRWFDLWMELDDQGRRYEFFFANIPYELSAGGYVDIIDENGNLHRYIKSFPIFVHKPFNTVADQLWSELEVNDRKLDQWSVEMLIADGEQISLDVKS